MPLSDYMPSSEPSAPRAHRTLRWVGGIVGALLLVFGGGFAVLQLDAVTTRAARWAIERALPPGTTVTLAHASGSVLGSLRLDSIRIKDSDGTVVLRASRVNARYDLTRLWNGEVHLSDVELDGLRATLTRRPDSTWALFPAIPATPMAPAAESGGWSVRIEKLAVTDATLVAVELSGDRHRVDDLAVNAHDLQFGDGTRGTVDSLGGRLTVAGHPDQPAVLQARMAWDPTQLTVDTLLVHTADSRVAAHGTLPLNGPEALSTETRFVVSADPIALGDVTPFFPAVDGGLFSADLEVVGDTASTLQFTLDVVAPDSGRLRVNGRARLGTEADTSAADTRLNVEGALTAFDPSSVLANDGVTGRLSGTVRTDLVGPDFQHLTGDVDVAIQRSVVNERVLDGGTLVARLTDGRVRLRAELDLDSLRLRADGELDPTADPLTYSVRAQVSGAVLSAALGTSPGEGTALITARGRGVPGSGTVALEAELDSAALAATTFASLRATGELRGDSLALALTAAMVDSAGTLRARVVAHPFDEPLRVTIRDGQLSGIDLQALTAAAPTSWLNARFTGALRGLNPDSMRAQFNLDVDSSRVGDRALHSGTVALRLAGGEVELASQLDFEDGHANVRVDAQPFEQPRRVTARATVVLGDGQFDANGWATLGADLAAAAGSLTVDARALGWRALRADSAHAEFRLADGTLRLDTLWVQSSSGTLDGGGTVPLVADAPAAALQLRAAVRDLDAVRESLDTPPLAIGAGTASLDVTGPADSLRVDAEAHIDAFSMGETRLIGFDAALSAEASIDSGLRRAEASLDFQRLQLAQTEIAQTTVELRYDPAGELGVQVVSRVDDQREVELVARFDAAATSRAWTLDRAELSLGGEQWSLTAPARVQLEPGLAVQELSLEGSGGGITFRGVLDSAGTDDFHVAVDSFPVEAVADLLGFERLGGRLTARVDIAGTSASRIAEGSARMDVRVGDRPLGLVAVDGALRDGMLELQGSVEQDERESATLAGSVPLDEASTREIDLRIGLDSLDAGLFNPFVSPDMARDFRGMASGSVIVAGPRDALRLNGTVDVIGGRVELPPLGVTWRDVAVVAQFEGDRVLVKRAQLSSGGGTLRADGALTLNGFTPDSIALDLTLNADAFRAIDTDQYHAVIGGQVDVQGSVAAPAVRGNLTVLRGDVHLGTGVDAGSIDDVVLTDADYAEVEDYFGIPLRPSAGASAGAFDSLTIDLDLDVGRDTWLRQDANPRVAVQLTGTMRIQKDAGPDLTLLGELETIDARSYVEQFGRRFDLRNGRVTFQGAPLDTRIDLTSAYTVPSRTDTDPEAVILLGIEGQAGELRVSLSSEPDMSNEDIVSYLATGRPAGQALALGGDGGEGGGLLSAGTGLALGQVAGLIEGYASDQIGLDVIDIRRDDVRGSTLVAGRYVSPRLYLGFKQPLSQPQGVTEAAQTRVEVEYQAYRWLLLNFESGGDALQFFLKARYGY